MLPKMMVLLVPEGWELETMIYLHLKLYKWLAPSVTAQPPPLGTPVVSKYQWLG